MSTTAALITGAKVQPYIDNRPDIKNMGNLCERNGFRISNVLVNTEELSKHSSRKVYTTKKEYRKTFISFLTESSENFLIYFYCGHGGHQWNEAKKHNIECLCLTQDREEWYKDVELTEDIDEYLPTGKTLYVILDACYSGGMINVWQLDSRFEKSVAFFCGANCEILAWDDTREGVVGGLFTNSFCLHAKAGRPLWQIADKVLVEMYKPYQRNARSPSVRYSRPAVAAEKFCQSLADGYLSTEGAIGISKLTGAKLFLTILDTDGDHRISRNDFEKMVDKKLDKVRSPDDLKRLRQRVLEMCDATGLVGGVSYSYEAYCTHLQSQLNGNPEVGKVFREIAAAYFDYLDADRNGYITLKEYHIFMATMGCTDEKEIKAGFESLDKDGDGKIIRKEWIESAFGSFSNNESTTGSRDVVVAAGPVTNIQGGSGSGSITNVSTNVQACSIM